MCDTIGKHSWIILVTYIFQVNQCEPVVVYVHIIRVFYPLAFEDGYSYSQAVIEFPYVFYVPIVRVFSPCGSIASKQMPLFWATLFLSFSLV
jgi:hypothetical protein